MSVSGALTMPRTAALSVSFTLYVVWPSRDFTVSIARRPLPPSRARGRGAAGRSSQMWRAAGRNPLSRKRAVWSGSCRPPEISLPASAPANNNPPRRSYSCRPGIFTMRPASMGACKRPGAGIRGPKDCARFHGPACDARSRNVAIEYHWADGRTERDGVTSWCRPSRVPQRERARRYASGSHSGGRQLGNWDGASAAAALRASSHLSRAEEIAAEFDRLSPPTVSVTFGPPMVVPR